MSGNGSTSLALNLVIADSEAIALSDSSLTIINKQRLLVELGETLLLDDLAGIRSRIFMLRAIITKTVHDRNGLLNIDRDGDTITLPRGIILGELNQIVESQTAERCKYYIQRLTKGVEEVRTGSVNDINLNRWKEETDILTDSLWVLERRDDSGAHDGSYWGNFIPQIPHQMMRRYTKKGDWVLDPFLGSGTTLIECRRLGRNGIGIELNPEVTQKTVARINTQPNPEHSVTMCVVSDCRTADYDGILKTVGISKVQLLVMHPPYHDIIRFSDSANDLSNAADVESFLRMFGEVVDATAPLLEKGRYFALVIGDKYSKGEWIPLGFYCMQEVLKRSFNLKSVIVKNFEETRGKRNQKELWRYRALVGGFYVFKHEYIFLFKKR